MKFCEKCDNMYYIKISENEGDEKKNDKLVYYCRFCGHEDINLDQSNFKVYKFESENKIKNKNINEFTKYDPTIPHLTTIKCPNESCSCNKIENPDPQDVLYIRYDDENMNYMYMCCLCDFKWKA